MAESALFTCDACGSTATGRPSALGHFPPDGWFTVREMGVKGGYDVCSTGCLAELGMRFSLDEDMEAPVAASEPAKPTQRKKPQR